MPQILLLVRLFQLEEQPPAADVARLSRKIRELAIEELGLEYWQGAVDVMEPRPETM